MEYTEQKRKLHIITLGIAVQIAQFIIIRGKQWCGE